MDFPRQSDELGIIVCSWKIQQEANALIQGGAASKHGTLDLILKPVLWGEFYLVRLQDRVPCKKKSLAAGRAEPSGGDWG